MSSPTMYPAAQRGLNSSRAIAIALVIAIVASSVANLLLLALSAAVPLPYDIDLLINQTLVYGLTTVAIGAAFFGGIVMLESQLRPVTGGPEIAVAASTLASFALFQPLLARLQGVVDRRFYRSRYDAALAVDAFSLQLRDEVDLDAVREGLVDATIRTVQPARASVWLRR